MPSPKSPLALGRDVLKLMEHNRARVGAILAPYIDANGNPQIRQIARVVVLFPRDGAGRLKVAISDFGIDSGSEVTHYLASASGFGYDKITAATAGMTVAGIQLGDHCDRFGRPTLESLIRDRGWTWIRGY